MALILAVEETHPKWGQNCFIAPNATIVGDVIMGDECSVWFNAVIRGDVNSVRIGNKVNIQDGAVIHCTFKKTKAIIGNNVLTALIFVNNKFQRIRSYLRMPSPPSSNALSFTTASKNVGLVRPERSTDGSGVLIGLPYPRRLTLFMAS